VINVSVVVRMEEVGNKASASILGCEDEVVAVVGILELRQK